MTNEPQLVRKALLEEIPPSSNHLYRNGYRGRRVLTKEGEAFANRTRAVLGQAWLRQPELDPNRPYLIHFTYYLPDLFTKTFGEGKSQAAQFRFRKRDVSNLRKLIEDVTAEMLGVDDSTTIDAITSKRYSKRPKVVIEVWQLPLSSCYDEHSEV